MRGNDASVTVMLLMIQERERKRESIARTNQVSEEEKKSRQTYTHRSYGARCSLSMQISVHCVEKERKKSKRHWSVNDDSSE